jgi:uncharacterized protein YkwD
MSALAKFSSAALSVALVIGYLAAALFPKAARSDVRYHYRDTEKCLMSRINDQRSRHGLHRLKWDRQLGFVARVHAMKMARRNRGFWHDHRLGNKVTRWRRLAQNTGYAFGCRSIFKTFWASSFHRRNMLGQWRFMGVGIARAGGRVYVQEIFESHTNPGNVFSFP